ncbi:hypothetical protein NDU88_000041 [Pleurodeles waltl]|uniref:Uncharacterized protein n=1 Tax=Pleurodeles waltl TaxID=8319 RepID=A0AAV7SVR6_PLEWA|nr:hypothetical protein NDU88_000035 [Pleurodeles waltl]KAJ1168087.1 hypothetical protein NDU88_000041 [Pleurodeles waltl]
MQCCRGEAARVCGAAVEGDAVLPRRGCQGCAELLGREMHCCRGEAARVCGAAGEGDAVLPRRGCQGCGAAGEGDAVLLKRGCKGCGAAGEGDAVLPKRGCQGYAELLGREMQCCRGEAAKGVWSCCGGRCSAAEERLPRVCRAAGEGDAVMLKRGFQGVWSCWGGRCSAAEKRLPRVCGAAGEGDAVLPRRGCQGYGAAGEGDAVLQRRGCQGCGAAGEGDAVLPRRGCQGCVELLGREMQCCRGEAAKGVWSCWGGRCSAAEERLPRVCGAAGEGDAVLPRRGCQGSVELLGREMQCCRGEAVKGVWSCWGGRCSAAEERLSRECGAAVEGDAVLPRRGCQGCAELLGREMQCCRGEAAKGVWSCWGGRCSAAEERLPRVCGAAGEGDALLPRRGCQGSVELLGREMQCCRGEAAKGVRSCWGGRCTAAEERLPRVCGAAGEGDAVLRRRGCQGSVELLGREMQCCRGEAAKGVRSCWGGRCTAAEERLPRVCGAAGEGDAVLPRRGCQGSVELLGREMQCCRGEAAKGVELLGREMHCCRGEAARVCGAAGEGDAVLPRKGCQGCAGLLGREMHCCRGEAARVCGAAGEGDAVLPRRGCQGCVELLWREMQCCRGEAARVCGAAGERDAVLPRRGCQGCGAAGEGDAVLLKRGCKGCGAAGEGDAVLPKRGCQGYAELLGREMQCCRGEAAKGVWSCCGGRCSAAEERLPRVCRAAGEGDAVMLKRGFQGVWSCWGGRCSAAEKRLPRVCGAAGEGDAVLPRRGCQGYGAAGEGDAVLQRRGCQGCGAAGEGDAVLLRRGCQGYAELLGRQMHCC